MIPEALRPIARRAILDLLNEIGGEQSHDSISVMITQRGRPIARRDVGTELRWLGEQQLVEIEEAGPFIIARILPDGRDISDGKLVVDGVWQHRADD